MELLEDADNGENKIELAFLRKSLNILSREATEKVGPIQASCLSSQNCY